MLDINSELWGQLERFLTEEDLADIVSAKNKLETLRDAEPGRVEAIRELVSEVPFSNVNPRSFRDLLKRSITLGPLQDTVARAIVEVEKYLEEIGEMKSSDAVVSCYSTEPYMGSPRDFAFLPSSVRTVRGTNAEAFRFSLVQLREAGASRHPSLDELAELLKDYEESRTDDSETSTVRNMRGKTEMLDCFMVTSPGEVQVFKGVRPLSTGAVNFYDTRTFKFETGTHCLVRELPARMIRYLFNMGLHQLPSCIYNATFSFEGEGVGNMTYTFHNDYVIFERLKAAWQEPRVRGVAPRVTRPFGFELCKLRDNSWAEGELFSVADAERMRLEGVNFPHPSQIFRSLLLENATEDIVKSPEWWCVSLERRRPDTLIIYEDSPFAQARPGKRYWLSVDGFPEDAWIGLHELPKGVVSCLTGGYAPDRWREEPMIYLPPADRKLYRMGRGRMAYDCDLRPVGGAFRLKSCKGHPRYYDLDATARFRKGVKKICR